MTMPNGMAGREGNGVSQCVCMCVCTCAHTYMLGGCNFTECAKRLHCKIETLVTLGHRSEGGEGASCVGIWRGRGFSGLGHSMCKGPWGGTGPGM